MQLKIKLKSILITLLVLSCFRTFGQNADPEVYEFTLQECIEYAIANSATTKNAFLDMESAEGRVRELLADGYLWKSTTRKHGSYFSTIRKIVLGILLWLPCKGE